MATGGSLCSWVKGQLEGFSPSANRKAFVAPGTQPGLCEIPPALQQTLDGGHVRSLMNVSSTGISEMTFVRGRIS